VVDADPLRLDGSTLRLDGLALAATGVGAVLDPDAVDRVAALGRAADRLGEDQVVYGRTTGVGAARDQAASAAVEHGLRLLRSHAAGWGELLPGPVVRTALVVRANQLLAGGSGAAPTLPRALADLSGAPAGRLPLVHRRGSLGTGDLTQLGEVGLALLGERPRADGSRHRDLELTSADALPLMSSNAFVLAEAGLHAHALRGLTTAADVVCALSFVAMRGNLEAVSPQAAAASPLPGVQQVADSVRRLVDGHEWEPAHLQDFFGLRTWPQVQGPLRDSIARLASVVETMVNTASENPVFTTSGDGPDGSTTTVTHHGGFHAASLALALDTTLLATCRSAQAVHSRVGHALTDVGDDLPLFLADEASGSSGLLIAEYVAASALAAVRTAASTPSSVQTVSVSAGIEDDASFAGEAATRLGDAVTAYRRLLAVELLCAVRTLRMRGVRLQGTLREVVDEAEGLGAGGELDVSADLDAAEEVVRGCARLATG
jgi:histidine ammonia-lyase